MLPVTKVTKLLVGEIWKVKDCVEEKGRVGPAISLRRAEPVVSVLPFPPVSLCFLSRR